MCDAIPRDGCEDMGRGGSITSATSCESKANSKEEHFKTLLTHKLLGSETEQCTALGNSIFRAGPILFTSVSPVLSTMHSKENSVSS
jgi:hypothetical protein